MPTSFTTQRSILRNVVLGGGTQLTLDEVMADAGLTYRARPDANGFFQIELTKESDYAYAGKGGSFATESRLIEQASSGDINARLDNYLAGWFLAMVMGNDAFTAAGPAPGAPVLSASTAGALAAATYYVKTTYVAGGGESLPSAESNLAVVVDDVLNVASPAASGGATGYNVYVGDATGTETKQTAAPIAIGTPWVEPTTGLIAGAALPVASTYPNTHVLTWMDTGAPAQVTNVYIEDAPGLKRKFQDMSCTKVVLSGTGKGSVTAKASFIGTGRYADGAMVALPALPTAQYLYGSDSIFSIGPVGAPVSLAPRVLSWEATFDHGNDLFRSCGGGVYPVFPRYGNPVCSLKVVVAIDTTTDIRDWMMEQTLLEAKIAINSGAASLTLDYPNVIIPKSDLSDDSKYVVYTIELDQNSILQPAGGQVCTATVLNTAPQYLIAA
ncbi:MAG: phage tail tube protein [Acidobacteriaceae bacterium]